MTDAHSRQFVIHPRLLNDKARKCQKFAPKPYPKSFSCSSFTAKYNFLKFFLALRLMPPLFVTFPQACTCFQSIHTYKEFDAHCLGICSECPIDCVSQDRKHRCMEGALQTSEYKFHSPMNTRVQTPPTFSHLEPQLDHHKNPFSPPCRLFKLTQVLKCSLLALTDMLQRVSRRNCSNKDLLFAGQYERKSKGSK